MASRDPGNGDAIFISDGERTSAIERLHGFFGEGRLTYDELSTRLDQAYAARTDLELDAVFQSLPKPPPPVQKDSRQLHLRSQANRIVGIATPAAVCTVIWAMTGHGPFWPEWVWLGTGVAVLGQQRSSSRRRHRELSTAQRDSGPLPPGGGTEGRRRILTAVFVDIVGSTEKALLLGDSHWREVLRRFEQLVDQELEVHHGRKLFTKGDEVVATFRSPGEAVRYACALRDAVRPLDLAVRAGVHTGEVEGSRTDLSGIALHIGQRISAAASPDEILVSSTVRELAHGSGIEFVDRGVHELRGLDGTWHLYLVGATN